MPTDKPTTPGKKTAKRTAKTAPSKIGRLTLNDAMEIAATNEKFAAAILTSPEKFQGPFNLKAAEVSKLKEMGRVIGDRVGDLGQESFNYE